ncbi:MAG: multiheme c-type cytochrome, partial [Thermodesulfobacteriota bacterium]
TIVKVVGMEDRMTSMGKMSFPVLEGWPNQGVGRINPNGSEGSCTSCHPRHSFAIEIARKPATCSQCHKGPDVPAYKVYSVSKHGNIYNSMKKKWDFGAVPWTVGRDFTSPTCAVCHMSLITDNDGKAINQRSHQMNDRLPWRIFGVIYAHAHPKSPDTTIIKNKAGLPLPTELTGEPVNEYLIDKKEQAERWDNMSKICSACHGQSWIDGYHERFLKVLEATNDMTLTSTQIMIKAWEEGAVKGLEQEDSIFNEAMEKMWVQNWLFYANSTRFASAMSGADYGVFANGRWYQSLNIQKLSDYLDFKLEIK